MTKDGDDRMRLTDRKHIAIIEAGVEVFMTAGFKAAHMTGIAARANVSKRTLYKHFSSKDHLLAAVIETIMEQSAEDRFVAYSSNKPLKPQLTKLFSLSMDRITSQAYHDFAKIVIPEAIVSIDRAKELTSRLSQTNQPIYTWIDAALKDRRIQGEDATTLAHTFSSILHAFGLLPQLFLGRETLTNSRKKKAIKQCVELFLSAYEIK